MQNRALRIGPVALGASAANIANCAVTSFSGPTGISSPATLALYMLITHIRVVNKTSSAATVSLYIGATGGSAAGTEFAFNGYSVAGNSYVDWYGRLRLDAADYLSGLASAGTTLTFEAEGEIGVN
jgi:hypothetical protein